jgi:outer membrane receptor protein involved in Fe transport
MERLNPRRSTGGLCCALALCSALAAPQLRADGIEQVTVTATRMPEPIDQVPADLSVVSGSELAARGATTMATALSLVPGVEAPPGGDAGPSSAVPAFWGLHEFDAFLLVVDGVPWGGAFNPGITTLSFNNVQRVEVLKGPAPVLYGATSFVGVVQVLSYPAGQAADAADLAFGTYDSWRGSASFALPEGEHFRQSLAVDGQTLGFADAREKVSDGHVQYRSSWDLGPGTLRADADVTLVRDRPPSPVLRLGDALAPQTPIDANFNPSDGRIDENKYHLAIGYTLPTSLGTWETLASYAYSDVTDVRGFLHPDLSGTADTALQHRRIDDGYLDTHLTHLLSSDSSLIIGADLLYGRGSQTSQNGNDAYTVPLDGSVLPPSTATIPVNELVSIDDRRVFTGQYLQLDWKPGTRWDVAAGFRLNEAYEHKDSSDEDLTVAPPQLESASVGKTIVRGTGTLGVSYRLWQENHDQAVVYADARNAFKPAAIDFGPDYTPDLLQPETARSYEAGLKGAAGDGRITYQAELFWLEFDNLVVATSSGALANAGKEKLKGAELEGRFQLRPDLALAASASYHDARYSEYVLYEDVNPVDVSGRQLPLSPHVLAAAGILYTPARGASGTLVARYVGRRYLDEENTAAVGGYCTLDANLGYAWQQYRVTVEGTNLTNQRPPVSASEFGTSSFYMLPARMLWLRLGYSFGK